MERNDDEKLKDAWPQVLEKLEKRFNKDIMDRWIRVIHPVSMNRVGITLGVGNDFYQSWLEENYAKHIREALSSVIGTNLGLSFVHGEKYKPKIVSESGDSVVAVSREDDANQGNISRQRRGY